MRGMGMPPYLPSLKWLQAATSARQLLRTRDYTRTLIASNNPEGIVLTVPVVGGGASTKRLKPEQLKISSHGDWPRLHLGAIEAAYGREPYFQHFFPEIEHKVRQYPEHLSELNEGLLTVLTKDLDYEGRRGEMARFRHQHERRYASICERLTGKVDPQHSVIETLFRIGPDILFLLP